MSTLENGTDILRARQVTNLLGLGLSTVYRLTEQGKLPHVRLGTAIRYRKSTLLAMMESQESRAALAVK